MVNMDGLMVEYDGGRPGGIVEYKHCEHEIERIDLSLSNFTSLADFYDRHGRLLPFFVVRYWPDEQWRMEVLAGNTRASQLLNEHHPDQPALPGFGWVRMSERDWANFCHAIRGRAPGATKVKLHDFNKAPAAIDLIDFYTEALRGSTLSAEEIAMVSKGSTESWPEDEEN